LKVLLTGASGFVGSHILDRLRARDIPTVLLLRPTSSQRFIAPHLPSVEVRPGSVTDRASLEAALVGITHVIHCAGATKARSASEFFHANQEGTRNLVAAANARSPQVERFVHISSLAATGPASPASPARESDRPQPVSDYGKSKLAGELEVRHHCRAPYVVLRPPAVYGPRDSEFLRLFKAVKAHLLPRPPGSQILSLVFVKDLAEAVVACLDHPKATNQTYFVASPDATSSRLLAEAIARQMNLWTVPLPLPLPFLLFACLAQELMSRLTGRPSVLSWQKFAEIRAPGWVCDSSLLERDTGYRCSTPLQQGLAETLDWYRREQWV
jgi:nucleoside-diphosphate-sugar epimerase